MAMVASTASPTDPPICRAVLSTPDANPASVKATPLVAAEARGVKSRPSAREMMQPGPEDVADVAAVVLDLREPDEADRRPARSRSAAAVARRSWAAGAS